MLKHALATAALLATVSAHAAFSLPSAAAVYQQSFDSLANTGTANAFVNNSTVPGISLFTTANAPVAAYRADAGTSNTGAFYSYGAAGSTERALGGIGSGSFTGFIALALVNDSALAFDSFTLSYDGEQWRNGGSMTAHTMAVEFGFGADFTSVVWTAAPSLSWTSPLFGAPAGVVDGNVAGLVLGAGGTVALDWTAGSTLWVRWIEANDPGSDHALAIDNLNVSVTAIPEPSTTALLLAGITAVGLLARRRA